MVPARGLPGVGVGGRSRAYAATTRVDSHTLRTTAIAMVERVAGHEVARAFAGHAEPNVTSRYAKASIEEVARAVSYLWDEPHPLAAPSQM